MLHPFRKAAQDLFKSMTHLRLKNMIYRFYVLLNGMVLHLLGIEFASPLGKRFESFQTKSGMARLFIDDGFTNISTSTDRHFVISAIKKGELKCREL